MADSDRRRMRGLVGFLWEPCPPGPRGYRLGGRLLRAGATLALLGLLLHVLVLALWLLGPIPISELLASPVGSLFVAVALYGLFLAFYGWGAVIAVAAGYLLVLLGGIWVTNNAYLRWVDRTPSGLLWARSVGALVFVMAVTGTSPGIASRSLGAGFLLTTALVLGSAALVVLSLQPEVIGAFPTRERQSRVL